MKLTVVFADDTPVYQADGEPTYRRVTVDLTDEQTKQLLPRKIGLEGKAEIYERLHILFLEDVF